MFAYTDELLATFNNWNGILSAPSKESLKKPNGIRVFKNSFIETTLRAHWIVPGLWVIPVVTLLVLKGLHFVDGSLMTKLVITGFFSWTILEYAIHKYVFHWPIKPTSPVPLKKLIFGLHGYHHEFPNDPSRLVVPVAVAWPLGLIVALLTWLVVGTTFFFGIYGGILLGYLAYDWTHYWEHHGRPTGRYGKYLHEFHAIHHFVDENKNMGISSPVWDWILGSIKEPRTKLFGNAPAKGRAK